METLRLIAVVLSIAANGIKLYKLIRQVLESHRAPRVRRKRRGRS